MAQCMSTETLARFPIPKALLEACSHEIIQTFDPAYYLAVGQPERQAYRERMLKQIVGFEIDATQIEAKFKISQNRTKEDQAERDRISWNRPTTRLFPALLD